MYLLTQSSSKRLNASTNGPASATTASTKFSISSANSNCPVQTQRTVPSRRQAGCAQHNQYRPTSCYSYLLLSVCSRTLVSELEEMRSQQLEPSVNISRAKKYPRDGQNSTSHTGWRIRAMSYRHHYVVLIYAETIIYKTESSRYWHSILLLSQSQYRDPCRHPLTGSISIISFTSAQKFQAGPFLKTLLHLCYNYQSFKHYQTVLYSLIKKLSPPKRQIEKVIFIAGEGEEGGCKECRQPGASQQKLCRKTKYSCPYV
jgi:hypothetical protein